MSDDEIRPRPTTTPPPWTPTGRGSIPRLRGSVSISSTATRGKPPRT